MPNKTEFKLRLFDELRFYSNYSGITGLVHFSESGDRNIPYDIVLMKNGYRNIL